MVNYFELKTYSLTLKSIIFQYLKKKKQKKNETGVILFDNAYWGETKTWSNHVEKYSVIIND